MKSKLLVSLALMAGLFFAACHHDAPASKLPAATADTKNVKYQCPMDCEKGKTYAEKGKCPVCKMDLALKETEHKDHEGHEDELDHEGHKDEKDHEGHDH